MKGKTAVIAAVIALCLAWTSLSAPPARAASQKLSGTICLNDLARLPELLREVVIPVGCELVDCCPGCPADAPLDWRVRVSGPAVASARLVFDGLPAAVPLKLEGSARESEGGVRIGPGEGWIRGLPQRPGDRVPLAGVALELDPRPLAELEAGDRDGAGEDDEPRVEVRLEQMLGAYVVNRFVLSYRVLGCVKPAPCDHVTVQNNRGGDDAVVLLDGRRAGGCAEDEIDETPTVASVGNVLSAAASCNSELEVFSEGDAMAMTDPEYRWTDYCGDDLVVDLDPVLELPVTFWLVRANSLSDAQDDLDTANLIFDQNKAGIVFDPTYEDIHSSFPAKIAVALGCVSAGVLSGTSFYTPGVLNVYYVSLSTSITGESCEKDRNVAFVGLLAGESTLAHELGHALSLHGQDATWGHTNTVPGFDKRNVMWGGATLPRRHLSLGQVFRFNVDPSSVLVVNGVRSGPTNDCPAKPLTATPDPSCPPLALDWGPH